ncbi:DUF1064 domain-containing protein [Ligilactobacillus equi]|uniref:Uncharacterized protein n=1 Tax=Ligilactobacillus equi DSM 15833 = JCM 10991 TaxID=1423740 RepID=A0A0R1TKL8_9LACO|nr:DUF1064 domain-containing protein [Ligilactobacillus equi]KRL81783.1 hypothetical protein FC36_GL001375 [Ligilactobacillus equi DSM 15833 = JCM 10991]
MVHFNKRNDYKGEKYDSQKEAKFYQRYLEAFEGSYIIRKHPQFDVLDRHAVGGMFGRKMVYTPDFVVMNKQGEILHVFDVKNSITPNEKGWTKSPKVYASDSSKMRIKLYQARYGIPVEIVVPMANGFRMTIIGLTKTIGLHEFNSIEDYEVWDYTGR